MSTQQSQYVQAFQEKLGEHNLATQLQDVLRYRAYAALTAWAERRGLNAEMLEDAVATGQLDAHATELDPLPYEYAQYANRTDALSLESRLLAALEHDVNPPEVDAPSALLALFKDPSLGQAGRRALLDAFYEVGLADIFHIAGEFNVAYRKAGGMGAVEASTLLATKWSAHKKFHDNSHSYDADKVAEAADARRKKILSVSGREEKWQFMLSLANDAYDLHLTAEELPLYGNLLSQLATHERGSHQLHMGEMNRMRHNPAIHTLHVIGLVEETFVRTWSEQIVPRLEAGEFTLVQVTGELQQRAADDTAFADAFERVKGVTIDAFDAANVEAVLRAHWAAEKHLMQRTALLHDMGELRGELSVGGDRQSMTEEQKEEFEEKRGESERNIFDREVAWHAKMHAVEQHLGEEGFAEQFGMSPDEMRRQHADYVVQKYAIRELKMHRDVLVNSILEHDPEWSKSNPLADGQPGMQYARLDALRIKQHALREQIDRLYEDMGNGVTEELLRQAGKLNKAWHDVSAEATELKQQRIEAAVQKEEHVFGENLSRVMRDIDTQHTPDYQAKASQSRAIKEAFYLDPDMALEADQIAFWSRYIPLRQHHVDAMEDFDRAEDLAQLQGLGHKALERIQSQNDFIRFEGTGGGERLKRRDVDGGLEKNHAQWQANYPMNVAMGNGLRPGVLELAEGNGVMAGAIANQIAHEAHLCAARTLYRMPEHIRWVQGDSATWSEIADAGAEEPVVADLLQGEARGQRVQLTHASDYAEVEGEFLVPNLNDGDAVVRSDAVAEALRTHAQRFLPNMAA